MFGEFLLWDIRSNSNKASYICKIGSNYGSLHSIATDPTKNDKFIGGTQSGHICVWDLRKNETSYNSNIIKNKNSFDSFLAHSPNTIVTDLSFANNGFNSTFGNRNRNEQNILSCGNDGTIVLWKLNQENNSQQILHNSGTSPVTQMHFNQHLNVVAACSDKPCLVIAQLE